MAIMVRNVKLGLEEPEERLLGATAKKLKVPPSAVRVYAPVRRSLDARKHDDVHFVYHVEVALDESERRERARVQRLRSPMVTMITPVSTEQPVPGKEPLRERPIIVGFGPAGIFAALRLTQLGYSPIVLERGLDVRRRHRDVLQTFFREGVFNPESNLLFGEGGAGAYSDGKLYTSIRDPLVRTVLEWFYRYGADPDILVNARPHIGSDRLPTICQRMREGIQQAGGDVRFASRLDDVVIDDGRVSHIRVDGQQMAVGPVVLAIGHSARDTVQMLHRRGVAVQARPFQMGVRIEHPQSMVDHWQYGQSAGHDRLPPAEYRVVAKGAAAGGDCYSFCMCPGGIILPVNESEGLIATNGASRSGRSGPLANCGLVITVHPAGDQDPLSSIAYQRTWEQKAFHATGGTYRLPCQRAGDFLEHRPSDGELRTSCPLGGQWSDIHEVIPPDVSRGIKNALRTLELRMPGFAGSEAIITAPETRASTPVRFPRDPQLRTALGLDNLYPTGEGAGYAGGIISSAVDGIKTADAIIHRYAPSPAGA